MSCHDIDKSSIVQHCFTADNFSSGARQRKWIDLSFLGFESQHKEPQNEVSQLGVTKRSLFCGSNDTIKQREQR